MITEFRNAVSCKKTSRMRRRRPLSSSAALRHPTRIALGAPRPLRLVREMRLSNGKLYSGAGPLTGGAGGGGGGGGGAGGTGPVDLGPGPQRILDDPLGANTTPPPPAPTPVMLPARSCTHVRICQECRRIQSLRSGTSIGSTTTRIPPSSAPLPRLPPPPPPSSSNTDSEGGGGPSPRRLHHSPPPHTSRPIPPPQNSNTTDLLGDQDWDQKHWAGWEGCKEPVMRWLRNTCAAERDAAVRFIGEQKRERRREVVELHKVSQRKKAMTFKRRMCRENLSSGGAWGPQIQNWLRARCEMIKPL